ncbi:MAG: hypothetical protein AAB874_05125 [Patescibacteria group bacterium]
MNSKRYHAEQSVITAWEDRDHLRLILKRKAPDKVDKKIIVTTRELCSAMCTGRILSTGIDMVMIGTSDVAGGGMLDGRENHLTPAFKRKWKKTGLQVMVADYGNPKSPSYLNPDFMFFLNDIFRNDRVVTKDPYVPSAKPTLKNYFDELPVGYAYGLLPQVKALIKSVNKK